MSGGRCGAGATVDMDRDVTVWTGAEVLEDLIKDRLISEKEGRNRGGSLACCIVVVGSEM